MNINEMMNKTVYPSLKAGAYKVKLKSYNIVQNDKGGYLAIHFTLPTGQPIQHNVFPTGIEYLSSNLFRQSGLDTPMSLTDLLNHIGNTHQDIEIWVSYNEYGRNIALHDTTPQQQENISSADLSKLLRM